VLVLFNNTILDVTRIAAAVRDPAADEVTVSFAVGNDIIQETFTGPEAAGIWSFLRERVQEVRPAVADSGPAVAPAPAPAAPEAPALVVIPNSLDPRLANLLNNAPAFVPRDPKRFAQTPDEIKAMVAAASAPVAPAFPQVEPPPVPEATPAEPEDSGHAGGTFAEVVEILNRYKEALTAIADTALNPHEGLSGSTLRAVGIYARSVIRMVEEPK